MDNTDNQIVEAKAGPEPESESCVDTMSPEPQQMSMLVYDNKHLLSDGAVATYQHLFLQHEQDRIKKMEELQAPLFKIEYIKTTEVVKNLKKPDSESDEDVVHEISETDPGIKPTFLVAWLRGKTGFCRHMKRKVFHTLDQGVIPIMDTDCKKPYWGKGCQLNEVSSVGGIMIKVNITILNIERYS